MTRHAILFLLLSPLALAQAPKDPPVPLPYDTEYPFIPYNGMATHNPVARLQERLTHGGRLPYAAPRGYLDALLKALSIEPSSQVLVFSKTSLQSEAIDATAPRAIYFNDDTAVAWVPRTQLLEIATLDSVLGPVFYTLDNRSEVSAQLTRQNGLCLQCHDTYALLGGGVPRFIFLSSVVNVEGHTLTGGPGVETTDETPIRERWGGWFVTGKKLPDQHRGDVLVKDEAELADPSKTHPPHLTSIQGVIDTHTYPYPVLTSDIVALLVLEHQVHVKDLIVRVSYKSRSVMERQLGEIPQAATWDALPPRGQKLVKSMLENLLRGLLMVKAAPLESPIQGGSGFDAWFQKQGPRDPQGRSLRELDLKTRLFRYPLSYLVYSTSFQQLPGFAQDYLYHRIAEVLKGQDTSPDFALDPATRKATLEILLATDPAFAKVAG